MRLKLNKEFNVWEEAKEKEPYDLFVDGWLLRKLMNIEKLQNKNWDCPFLICGGEGSGKSTLGFVCAQYLTKMNITLDNIANGSDDALDKLQRLPDRSTIIIDEAELLFSSRETMTREQRQLTKILMIIRQKRMVLILITPSFFDLSKYIAVDRSKFLLRVYANSQLERGKWAYWGTRRKQRLYYEGKKTFGSYAKPRPEMHGVFLDYKLPFDAEYQKVKLATLLKAFEKKGIMPKEEKKEEKE